MSTKARVIERVRKLLAKANDASSPEEAAVAASMAEKTMRKYQIENYEVTLADARKEATVATYKVNPKIVPRWVGQLAVAVARLHEVYTYRIGGVGSLRFVGLDVDVEVAVETLRYLTDTVNRLAKAHKGGVRGNNSFRAGATVVLCARLREMSENRQNDTSTSKELVVCKQALIDNWKESTGIVLRKGSTSKTSVDMNSYVAGCEAGRNIGLNKQVTAA